MKNIVSSIVMLFALATMSAQPLTMELEKFDALKVYDLINVTLIKSSENKAVITGDDVDKVDITNKDGKLKVRMDLVNFMDGDQTDVALYHTEDMRIIDSNEGAWIMSENSLEGSYVILNAQEGGKVNVPVNSTNLDVKAVTGGAITANGTSPNLEVVVRTGGHYHGKELSSDQADVNVFAGGDALVYADQYVEANVTAGGTIEIFGNPKKIDKTEAFGGSIMERQ
jgi:hypothetical protein